MPYFTTVMARSIQDTPDSSDANNQMGTTSPTASVSTRTLRTMPGNGSNGSGLIYKDIDPQLQQRYRYEVTQRKLLFMRSLIRAQVNQLLTGAPPYSVEEAKKIFAEYHINRSNSLHEDANIAMYEASNPSKRDINLMVTIYTRRQLDPERSMYLKIINHLGRKHPFIIYTTDIFCDASHVYIFQELIPKGNVLMYLESRPAATIDEAQIRFWSKQLYQAMDFLGDQAIAHRNIAPNHLVMKPMGRETWIKLTGFKNAIIYWDVKRNDVRNCACLPAAQQKVDGANFQAPEVYGDTNTEEFDPIMADLWSYGANLYFIIARQYPFDLATLAGDQAAASPDNIDAQIWQNISRITWLSAEGKQFLFALLRINANDRIPFDFISHDPWLSVHTKISPKTVLQTPFKNLEKIKVAQLSTAAPPDNAAAASASDANKSANTTNLAFSVTKIIGKEAAPAPPQEPKQAKTITPSPPPPPPLPPPPPPPLHQFPPSTPKSMMPLSKSISAPPKKESESSSDKPMDSATKS